MLLDLWMPHVSGEELLQKITADYPDVPVIVVTGADDVETAVRCMRQGAFDYIVKPVEKSRLVSSVSAGRRAARASPRKPVAQGARAVGPAEPARGLCGHCHRQPGDAVDLPVCRGGRAEPAPAADHRRYRRGQGAGGPGRAHPEQPQGRLRARQRGRAGRPRVRGHPLRPQARALSPAPWRRGPGCWNRPPAERIFLDEIGDLSAISQVKLLRLLQEGEYLPLGSDLAKRSDARIVVATNQDLEAARNSGRFRKDLYYRLCGHHIHILPLRERREDLPVLLDHFLEKAAVSFGKKKPTPPDELVKLLAVLSFPRQRPGAGIHGVQRGQPPRLRQAFDGRVQIGDIQKTAGAGRRAPPTVRKRRRRRGSPSRSRCRPSNRLNSCWSTRPCAAPAAPSRWPP